MPAAYPQHAPQVEPGRDDGQDLILVGTLRAEVLKRIQETALAQNIGTLHKRVNELGVAEPVIQQQGIDRVVVDVTGDPYLNLEREAQAMLARE
mgnify:CR=1 FL=1